MKTTNLFVAAIAAALLLASPAWAAYVDVIRADSPVGYFRMNETIASGDLVSSTTGAGAIHNAAASEPGPVVGNWLATFASGGLGEVEGVIAGDGAVDFQWQRSSARASTVPTSSSFTMEAWFKTDPAKSTPGGTIVSLTEDGVVSDAFEMYIKDGVLKMHFRNGFSTAYPAGTTAVVDAQWHHVAMVCTPGHASLYLDGAATPEIDVAVSQSWNGVVDTLRIGGRDRNTSLFVGALDEVAVYNTALSPAQITAHYDAVPEPATLGLLALGGLAGLRRRR